MEEPDNNPLQNDLGLVLKVVVNLSRRIVVSRSAVQMDIKIFNCKFAEVTLQNSISSFN